MTIVIGESAMQYSKVEICGVDTSKLRVLKEKEKLELLKKIREGDKSAREKLINGNLRLVLSVIQRFTNRGENLDDLFQVGVIGLIKAIDNFDVSLKVRFSTYAVPMIIGEIRRYLRDNNTVRVSRSVRDTAYHALGAKEKLQAKLGRDPTVDEIAKELGTSRSDIVLALEAIVEPVSLFEPVYSDGGDTIYVMDQVGGSETDTDWLDEISIKESIKELSPREKRYWHLDLCRGKRKWRWRLKSVFHRRRYQGLRRGLSGKSKNSVIFSPFASYVFTAEVFLWFAVCRI